VDLAARQRKGKELSTSHNGLSLTILVGCMHYRFVGPIKQKVRNINIRLFELIKKSFR
jgi:hypothetical protein